MHRAAVLLDGLIDYASKLVRVPYTLEAILQKGKIVMASQEEVTAKIEAFKSFVSEKFDGVGAVLANVDAVLDAVLVRINALIEAGSGGSAEALAAVVAELEAAQESIAAKAAEVSAQGSAVLSEAQSLAGE
jgi:hypothetical protein